MSEENIEEQTEESQPEETPSAPTDNSNVSEEQWQAMEAKFGMDRDQIKSVWNIQQAAMAPVLNELHELKKEKAINKNIQTVMGEAAKTPQYAKLRPHIEEYMADVPDEVKADPARLKKEVEKAIRYAKGSVPVADRGEFTQETPLHDEGGEVQEVSGEDKFFGVHTDANHKTRLEVIPLVDKDYRKQNTHPENPGGVQINERAEWDAVRKNSRPVRNEKK